MQYLKLENVSKSYGEKLLFSNIQLTISKGEKIALIAKNGTGKTTLLRVIAGEEGVEGESAKVLLARNIKFSFLHQEPELEAGHSVFEAIYDSDNPTLKAVRSYREAMEEGNEEKTKTAMVLMDDLRAWDMESRVEEVLSKLSVGNLKQKIGQLSGGQKKRVALAKIILDEPDFLILDEPTNHLDIEMIEWLEEYLKNASFTLFLVSHDRYFIEKVCNEIIELDQGNLYIYRGNYSQYLEKKDMRMQQEAANYDKNLKLFKRELDWMRRQPQARTTKAKSRIDDFYEIKDQVSGRRDTDEMRILIEPQRLGTKIVELHSVTKSYGELCVLQSFSYKFKRGERVGIVGRNGTGKSTLLKLITGEEEPVSGKIIVGETVVFSHYNQDGMNLNKDKTVIDVVRDIAEFVPLAKGLKLTAESLLERFLFPRSMHRILASQLSGGERRRLFLLTILMRNPNFLILDEPTNDLDILTLNVLEDYLMDFPGCLLVVSHDRYFMDKLVDHIFVIEENGKLVDFNGNYTEYREQQKTAKQVSHNDTTNDLVSEKKSDTKREFELRKEIKALEKQLEKLQEGVEKINKNFENPDISQEQIIKFSKDLTELRSAIEDKEMAWMELNEELETVN
jgi:ABC transport system ATP-binding/permease protein